MVAELDLDSQRAVETAGSEIAADRDLRLRRVGDSSIEAQAVERRSAGSEIAAFKTHLRLRPIERPTHRHIRRQPPGQLAPQLLADRLQTGDRGVERRHNLAGRWIEMPARGEIGAAAFKGQTIKHQHAIVAALAPIR